MNKLYNRQGKEVGKLIENTPKEFVVEVNKEHIKRIPKNERNKKLYLAIIER